MVDMKAVIAYQTAMELTRLMLKIGIITSDELFCIEAVLAEKYGLKKGSIFREKDLLYSSCRANMSHYEEVKPDANSH